MAAEYTSSPDFTDLVMMPVTLLAHHGLVDGLHVARFYEELEKGLDFRERE